MVRFRMTFMVSNKHILPSVKSSHHKTGFFLFLSQEKYYHKSVFKSFWALIQNQRKLVSRKVVIVKICAGNQFAEIQYRFLKLRALRTHQ